MDSLTYYKYQKTIYCHSEYIWLCAAYVRKQHCVQFIHITRTYSARTNAVEFTVWKRFGCVLYVYCIHCCRGSARRKQLLWVWIRCMRHLTTVQLEFWPKQRQKKKREKAEAPTTAPAPAFKLWIMFDIFWWTTEPDGCRSVSLLPVVNFAAIGGWLCRLASNRKHISNNTSYLASSQLTCVRACMHIKSTAMECVLWGSCNNIQTLDNLCVSCAVNSCKQTIVLDNSTVAFSSQWSMYAFRKRRVHTRHPPFPECLASEKSGTFRFYDGIFMLHSMCTIQVCGYICANANKCECTRDGTQWGIFFGGNGDGGGGRIERLICERNGRHHAWNHKIWFHNHQINISMKHIARLWYLL